MGDVGTISKNDLLDMGAYPFLGKYLVVGETPVGETLFGPTDPVNSIYTKIALEDVKFTEGELYGMGAKPFEGGIMELKLSDGTSYVFELDDSSGEYKIDIEDFELVSNESI